MNKSDFDRLVRDTINRKDIYGAVFYISSDDKSLDYISAAGNFREDSSYYIASINKIFVSAVILKLAAEKQLALHDKLSNHLPPEILDGLHIFKGVDYSDQLLILHLISQTSGLPCYLIDKQANGRKAMTELEESKKIAHPKSILSLMQQQDSVLNIVWPPRERHQPFAQGEQGSLRAAANLQFAENLVDVRVHGRLADDHYLGNFLVAQTLCHQL